jgi:hypothetical protein
MATTQTGMSGTTGTRGGMQSGTGQSRQGASDVTYDIISVLYHALQGCETYEQYAQDAEQSGHQDVAQFFRDALQQDRQLAQRGRELLMQCLQREQGQGGGRSGQFNSQNSGAQGQQGSSGSR